MFYQFDDDVTTVEIADIDNHYITAGYVTINEFEKIYNLFGFSSYTFDCCKETKSNFYSVCEIYDDYTFATVSLNNLTEDNNKNSHIAIYVKKNLLIIVDIDGKGAEVRDNFFSAFNKYGSINISIGKLLYSFFDSFIKKDNKLIENAEFEINQLEQLVLEDKANENFNFLLLRMKKELLVFKNYYEQLNCVSERLIDNENEILEDDELKYVLNFKEKIKIIKEDIDSLKSSIIHLQEAYSAYLDLKLNQTMKIFTVVTTIFFPLTLIVGWYGMNFTTMPEFAWKYGYLFVIILSVTVVAVLTIIVKKRKWL